MTCASWPDSSGSPVLMLVGTEASLSALDGTCRDCGWDAGSTLPSVEERCDPSWTYAMGAHIRQWSNMMCVMRLARSVSLAVSGCRWAKAKVSEMVGRESVGSGGMEGEMGTRLLKSSIGDEVL